MTHEQLLPPDADAQCLWVNRCLSNAGNVSKQLKRSSWFLTLRRIRVSFEIRALSFSLSEPCLEFYWLSPWHIYHCQALSTYFGRRKFTTLSVHHCLQHISDLFYDLSLMIFLSDRLLSTTVDRPGSMSIIIDNLMPSVTRSRCQYVAGKASSALIADDIGKMNSFNRKRSELST